MIATYIKAKITGLEKQQKPLLIMRLMLPNFRIMWKPIPSIITHAENYHIFYL